MDILSTLEHEISFLYVSVFELKDDENPAPVGEMQIIFSGPIASRIIFASVLNVFQKSRCFPVENVRLYGNGVYKQMESFPREDWLGSPLQKPLWERLHSNAADDS